jgi:hypothetical protein
LNGLLAIVTGGLDTYIEPTHNGASGLKIVIDGLIHVNNAVYGFNIGSTLSSLVLVHTKGAAVLPSLRWFDLLFAFIVVGLFFLPPLPKHHTTVIENYGPCRSEVQGTMPRICSHCCAWNYYYFERDCQVDETLKECDL